jgi:exonuclease VII large subunit
MFNKSQTDLRISLLEEKQQTQDEISKQMLEKLEQAVEKISESTRDISQILIRHEERIERSVEVNNSTVQIINRIEKDLEEDIKGVNIKVNDLSKELDGLKSKQWLWAGVILAVSFFVGYYDNIQMIKDNSPPAPTSSHAG